MAWSTPLTAVANAALTAAQWNLSVRDNLLETPAAKATTVGSYFVTSGANAVAERILRTNRIDTSETTVSTTYAALTTAGPVATATAVAAQALVMLRAAISNSTSGVSSFMGVAVSGATTIAASDSDCLRSQGGGTTDLILASSVQFIPLTAGSNTFTTQYRVGAGTGTFALRSIIVLPM